MSPAHYKAALHHVGHDGDTLGTLEHILGYRAVGSIHQLTQVASGLSQAIDDLGLFTINRLARCGRSYVAVRASREYRQQEKQLNYHQLTHNLSHPLSTKNHSALL